MRVVVQRVREAAVTVDGEVTGSIGRGLLLLVGIHQDDDEGAVRYLVDKVVGLRVFPDEEGRMNRSVRDVGGGILVVSQFTLYGDCRRGRRPSFVGAAGPEKARPLYERWLEWLRESGVEPQAGIFGASMAVSLVNDGPVTLLLDSSKAF